MKSVVMTTRSPLFFDCFDFERLVTKHYLMTMTFHDMQTLTQDFFRLPKIYHRIILLLLVKIYHLKYQRKIKNIEDALEELMLRLIFETLKTINATTSLSRFKKDIYKSWKREKNHQIRICILMKKCKTCRDQLPIFCNKSLISQVLQ